MDDADAANEGQEFYIDYISTEDNDGNAMDVLRFMHKSRDREPMVPVPHLIEMMNPHHFRDRQVAVSRLIVAACGARAERYLDADDISERWLISLVNDTSYKPRTRLISARRACAVLKLDGPSWGDQQRMLLRPMKKMAADVVADKLGGLHYFSKLYVGDTDVELPPDVSSVPYFEGVRIKSVGGANQARPPPESAASPLRCGSTHKNAFLGRASPSQILPRVLRSNQRIGYECGLFLHEALLGGVWEGFALPRFIKNDAFLGRTSPPQTPPESAARQ